MFRIDESRTQHGVWFKYIHAEPTPSEDLPCRVLSQQPCSHEIARNIISLLGCISETVRTSRVKKVSGVIRNDDNSIGISVCGGAAICTSIEMTLGIFNQTSYRGGVVSGVQQKERLESLYEAMVMKLILHGIDSEPIFLISAMSISY